MSDIAISVNNLSKDYCLYKKPIHRVFETFFPSGKKYHTSFSALSNINFQVKRGEAIGVIGRNGSGKSTLLQIICNVLQPTKGEAVVNGRISALLELGAGFNPEFTGRENVFLSTAIMGLSKTEIEARFDDIAAFAEIGDFIDRPVKMYSSGMYVRLAFATAVSVDPDILIVDEALAVGDIFFQQKCVEHMRKMMETCTIILVSHDMHAVSNLCDRVVVLDKGVQLYDGKPGQAIALYTKLMHTEQFSRKSIDPETDSDLSEDVANRITGYFPDFNEWLSVPEVQKGGAGEVQISKVSVTKEGLPFKTVQKGEKVTIRLLILSSEIKNNIIFGYTVKDRVGVALFGQNSLDLRSEPITLKEGFSVVEYTFFWPEVYPEEYTLTVGIGEGDHPLIHSIQCWAHNIVSFNAVTNDQAVHGIFNNPVDSLQVTSVS